MVFCDSGYNEQRWLWYFVIVVTMNRGGGGICDWCGVLQVDYYTQDFFF